MPPATIWRVARLGMGTEFSWIDPVGAASPHAGNRFDVVGGGVLYGATRLEGCYRETLARLRPAPHAASLDEDSTDFMRAGQVAASWRENRRRFSLTVLDPLPFLDVEDQGTWNAIEEAVMLPAGVSHLDVGHVRGADRTLTRLIAAWAYAEVDEDGDPLYSGIRYLSRTGNFECWAIFDGTQVQEAAPAGEISLDDAELRRVAQDFQLTLH